MKNTPPQNTDWVERFEDQFDGIGFEHLAVEKKKLLEYILSEKDLSYQQGREDMRKEILEGIPDKESNSSVSEYYSGFNQALSQVQKVIKEIKDANT